MGLFRQLLLAVAGLVVASALPSGWTELGPSNSNEKLRLSFALRQQGRETLEQLFWDVSSPQSSSYGQFLSFEELKALIAPANQTVEAALAVLQNQEEVRAALSPGGDYIDADMPARVAASLLSAEIRAYRSDKSGLVYHRALKGFTLPAALAAHVEYVFPLARLPVTLKRRQKTLVLAQDPSKEKLVANGSWPRDCKGLATDGMITQGVLRKRYNVSLLSGPRKGSIAVALPYDPVDGCGFVQDDIVDRNRLCSLGEPVKVEVKGDGASRYCPQTCKKNIGDSCGESNLDIQTATGLADGVRAEFWIYMSGEPLDLFKQVNEDP